MTQITIRQTGVLTVAPNAKISFDGEPGFPVTVENPFSAAEEERLAWYFEKWLTFPFTDGVKAAAAAASRAQRVGDVPFPDGVVGRVGLRRVPVGMLAPDRSHATDPDDEPVDILEHRLAGLRVEDRQGFVGKDRGEEAIEDGALDMWLEHPLGGVDVRPAVRRQGVQDLRLGELLEAGPVEPAEWDRLSGVGRDLPGRLLEVAVRLLQPRSVGMAMARSPLGRGEEAARLVGTRREI